MQDTTTTLKNKTSSLDFSSEDTPRLHYYSDSRVKTKSSINQVKQFRSVKTTKTDTRCKLGPGKLPSIEFRNPNCFKKSNFIERDEQPTQDTMRSSRDHAIQSKKLPSGIFSDLSLGGNTRRSDARFGPYDQYSLDEVDEYQYSRSSDSSSSFIDEF